MSFAPARSNKLFHTVEGKAKLNAKRTIGCEVVEWHTLSDFYALRSSELSDDALAIDRPCMEKHCDSSWRDRLPDSNYCEHTWDGLQKLWADGADTTKLRRMADKMSADAMKLALPRKRKRRYGQEGDLDADRWLDRNYDAMFVERPRVQNRSFPIATIVFNWGGSWGKSLDELQWTGTAAAALVQALETSGWRVQLVCGIFSNVNGDGRSVQLIPIKRAEEPLRIGQLASIVCEPGTFRTLGFRAIAGAGKVNPGHGLGQHTQMESLPQAMQDKVRSMLPGNAMFVGSAYSESNALQEVSRIIKQVTQGGRPQN